VATAEELDEIRDILGVILFGRASPLAKKFPQLASKDPMSRRSPSMKSDPDFDASGNPQRASLDATATLVVNRGDLIGELSSDGPVSMGIGLEDLVGHLLVDAENATPVAEGDSFVDFCAFEDFRVEEVSGAVEIELVWCSEYPASELEGKEGSTATVRPFVDRAQPFVCAVECVERLSQAIGEEKSRELGLAHSVVVRTFADIRASK